MSVMRRLYGYLRHYKAWAFAAFGSMIIFALTQTVLVALVRPIFDDVLTPPGVTRKVAPNPRTVFVERQIEEKLPTLARAQRSFQNWWNANPALKWKRVLTILLAVFIIRAFTAFLS